MLSTKTTTASRWLILLPVCEQESVSLLFIFYFWFFFSRFALLDNVVSLAGNGYSCYVDGVSSGACFFSPRDIAVNPNDPSTLVIADTMNHAIRLLNVNTKTVTTLGRSNLGDTTGPLSTMSLNTPYGIHFDSKDPNSLWVADTKNGKLKLIDLNAREFFLINGKTNTNSQN